MRKLLFHNKIIWLIGGMGKYARMTALSCLVICAVSCRGVKVITKEVPVPVHDTIRLTKQIHDSVFVDRFVEVSKKGDTVFVTNNQITVKYRTVTDTAYKYVEKPVEVVVSQIKEVAKPLRWWQKGMMWAGVGFILVLIGFGVSFYVWLTNKKVQK